GVSTARRGHPCSSCGHETRAFWPVCDYLVETFSLAFFPRRGPAAPMAKRYPEQRSTRCTKTSIEGARKGCQTGFTERITVGGLSPRACLGRPARSASPQRDH